MALHEVLAGKRGEVLHRWQDLVRGTVAPRSMPPMELIDHLPAFLDEIVAGLRDDAGLKPDRVRRMACGHGEQRLRLGFSLDAVVREYGALRTAIVDTARDAGEEPTQRELELLFEAIIVGIEHAVSEYAHRRDAELSRQANEHFAFVAHELRNPLNSARIAFELLRRREQVPAADDVVVALERGLDQAIERIDHSLQMARFASGIELRRERTTLAELVKDAETVAAADAEFKGVTLRSLVEADESLDVDRRLVRSALDNLIRNGLKYTPAGGCVELRARVANGLAVLEVEDCCGGLPPGTVEKAFAPFVRLDQRQDGFGLGLAIAKQAVDAHGGSLRVQNLPGKGCIFILELPVHEGVTAATNS